MFTAFDFDGTLIKGDSIKHFARWVSRNKPEFYIKYYGLIFFSSSLTRLKFVRVEYFYRKMQERALSIEDFDTLLSKMMFEDTYPLLEQTEDDVLVVSASFKEIIGSFCKRTLKVELISNELSRPEIDVNGYHKVIALKESKGDDVIINKAYGNSKGDYPLLDYALKGYLRTSRGFLVDYNK